MHGEIKTGVTTGSPTFCGSLSHHVTVRPRVADGGDGLQIWRVAVHVLNRECQQGWSSSLGGWATGYNASP
jgi:hypothetical protein